MQITTDFVVLSSSPETSAIHFPPLPLGNSKITSLRDPSMSLSPSPAASPTASKRSTFFSTPPYSQFKTVHKTTQDASKERTTTTKTDENSASSENGCIRRGQKSQPISQVELQNIGQDNSENKENAPTKPKRARKKQEGSRTGTEKLKNKTISGKVTKTGMSKSRTSVIKPVKSKQGTCERNTGKDGCEKDNLQLELAMARRRDWTPTKNAANPVIDLDDEDDATNRPDGLGTLLSGYEYTGMAIASDRHKVLTNSGPTKRRRIEVLLP